MTKSYSTLQVKVHELESILYELLLLGPDTRSHHSLSKDIIKQKLDFIWNLLSAEVSSHPSSKPHHLQHISQRLESLDKAFHQWDTSPTLSHDENFDKGSTSFCTESCFNDDDFVDDKALMEFNGCDKEIDNESSFVYEDAEECFEDFGGDKELVEFERYELKREEKRESAFGSTCCALVGGVVIGMLFMGFIMIIISDCFDYVVDQTSFAIPT